MPTEVIHIVHHLVAICKKYKGIVFTDKHGNIISDNTDGAMPPDVTDTHAKGYGEITGVDDDNTTTNHNTIADDEITGVAKENGNTEDNGITPTQSGNNQNDDITGGSPNQATNNNTEIARVCETGNGNTNQTSDLGTENQTGNTEEAC